ncbi:hypothetical protein, partial [Mangrovactinospora gilvigrisea]|uniref:hypothetical protein n=1 Tax=Mangrovactinospora gilvigrisea TaxID=1428644 RepID=UPI001114BEF2
MIAELHRTDRPECLLARLLTSTDSPTPYLAGSLPHPPSTADTHRADLLHLTTRHLQKPLDATKEHGPAARLVVWHCRLAHPVDQAVLGDGQWARAATAIARTGRFASPEHEDGPR